MLATPSCRRILVDADALPGVIADLLYRAARRRLLPMHMVSCRGVRLPSDPLFTQQVVAISPDAADDAIVEAVQPGDLVITQDIPLADRVLAKGGHALNPRGLLYTPQNIKERLATRDLMDELRSSGEAGGGPPPFSDKNREAFANALDRFLTRHQCR